MIKIENVVLPNAEQWEAIIRGMRNPLNSWDKSDSNWYYVKDASEIPNNYIQIEHIVPDNMRYLLGTNDLDLMKRLNKAGTEHRKFMRMIPIYIDITAPLYWWKEFDTYKIGTVCNSCSTMHKIHSKEFTWDDFSHEHLTHTDAFHMDANEDALNALQVVINALNYNRKKYLETKDKTYWWQMIQLLPSSYNQKRTIMLNYEVLASMYYQRKNHKLDEWREFCEWIKTLPCSKLITGEEDE